jgi:putative peptide maturation system protein
VSIPDSILATLPNSQLSLSGLLQWLRRQGNLRSLVFDALIDQLIQDEARQAGLSVSREELQFAADVFRRRHGLGAAADTHTWLSEKGMSVDDFKAQLWHDLVVTKLRQHLTAARIEEHFTAHQAGYERLRLAQLCVGREDLANELASQVREEGRDLDAVAGENRVRLERGGLFLKELAGPLAEALSAAGPGQLVGPVETAEGFVLALVEERQPAALDTVTRQQIENELFTAWLAERMREARIDPAMAGTGSGGQ